MKRQMMLFAMLMLISVMFLGTAACFYFTTPRMVIPPPRVIRVEPSDISPESVPTSGPKTAVFTLVEFGDYLCPVCGAAESTVEDIVRRGKGRVRRSFQHFVAAPSHAGALELARGAAAARRQGHFWQMHSAMFADQRDLGAVSGEGLHRRMLELARQIGMDTARFESDLKSREVATQVAIQTENARRHGISATPAFFIVAPNGACVQVYTLGQLRASFANPEKWKYGTR